MFVRRFVGGWFAVLMILVLLAVVGSMGYQHGWERGLLTAQALSEGGDGAKLLLAPDLAYAGHPSIAGPLLTVLGVLVVIMLLFMLLGMIGKLMMFRAWRTADGPDVEQWVRWHHHSHRPNWWAGWDKPSQIEAVKPEGEPQSEQDEQKQN